MESGVGIMAKVLSLMATYTGDGSQYFRSVAEIDDQLSNIEENKGYAGTPYRRCVHADLSYIKCVHTRSHPVHEVRTPRSLSSRQRKAHVGFLMVGPWYLADVLCYYGFGPWYCDRPKAINREGDHLAKASFEN